MTATEWARDFCNAVVEQGGPRPDDGVVRAVLERLALDLHSDPDEDASNHARRVLNLVTDNPAVVAVMGTVARPCVDLGCQWHAK